jgi:alcohol dehydrogenase (cytochrome c)
MIVTRAIRVLPWAFAGTLTMTIVAFQQGSAEPPVAAKEWLVAGGDLSQSRYSRLDQINVGNVRKLGAAWRTQLGAGESSRATPVVKDGLMFLPTPTGVHALDARTGQPAWTYRPERATSGTRGVALGEGLVFVPLSDSRVVALRQKTGEQVWMYRITEAAQGLMVTAAAIYADGRVFVGISGGDNAMRCWLSALDAKTGAEVWRFYSVPGPGEFGHETWPADNDVWKRGGGAVWQPLLADTTLGLVYFATGNAYPPMGGEVRGGDNLFTASVVAVDLKTGKYRWHFQLTHHDLWEADVTTMALFDTVVNGEPRKGLAATRRDGHVFMFDRATGKPLYAVVERPVKQDPRLKTAATQPFPDGADQLVPDCAQQDMVPPGFVLGCFFDPVYFDRPNVMTPLVGTNLAPMSYSPQTGLFYFAVSIQPFWLRRTPDPITWSAERVPGQKIVGKLVAFDSRTQKIVWEKRVPYHLAWGSGAMTTAGGLLFHGRPDGNFQAYDAKTGELLWEFQTGGALDAPPATYELDGEQYVALSGYANNYHHAARGSGVWAFKLGGTVKPLPAPRLPWTEEQFAGVVEMTTDVRMSGVVQDYMRFRQYVDEYVFRPARVQAKVGSKVTWTNMGTIAHSAVARDGSWATGRIDPLQSASVTFDKPGTYTYICGEHPWSIAQLVVE